jgi:hypothetical protein
MLKGKASFLRIYLVLQQIYKDRSVSTLESSSMSYKIYKPFLPILKLKLRGLDLIEKLIAAL